MFGKIFHKQITYSLRTLYLILHEFHVDVKKILWDTFFYI